MTYRQAVKHIRKLEQENEQYRTEKEGLYNKLMNQLEVNTELRAKYHGMKAERDSLITDLDVLRKNKLEYEERVGFKTTLKFIMFIIVFLILSAVLKTILF